MAGRGAEALRPPPLAGAAPAPAPAAPAPAPASHGDAGEASEWLQRWAHLLGGRRTALDVAAGSGRHVRFLASLGLAVCAVDRDEAAAREWPPGTEAHVADIESGPWPFAGRRFDVVVVTRYLWRPLLAPIVAAVAPNGLLIYETFAVGQEQIGRPANPDFLLRPGELLAASAGLRTIAYEDVRLESPARCVQRIAAVRPPEAAR